MTTIVQALRARAAEAPDRVALEVWGHGSLTFRDWAAGAETAGARLRSSGAGAGDSVVVALEQPEWVEFAILSMAASLIGARFTPILPTTADNDLPQLIDSLAPDVLVTSRKVASSDCRVFSPPELLADARRCPARDKSRRAVDVIYTSGSTGRPEGIELSPSELIELEYGHVLRRKLSESPKYLCSAAQGTNWGQGLLRLAVSGSATPVFMSSYSASAFADAIRGVRPRTVAIMPMMVRSLVRAASLEDVSCVRVVISSSAFLAPAEFTRLGEAFPDALVYNVFAMTEGPTYAQRYCVGKEEMLGLAGDDSEIRDSSGRRLPSGAPGHLWVRLPPGRRYANVSLETERVRDGWLYTGDIARIDSAGYLELLGREKDVVTLPSGHKTATKLIEGVLLEEEEVIDAAVVGVPGKRGEKLVAFVVLVDSDVSTLKSRLRNRLKPWEFPREIHIVEQLPRLPSGKIDKDSLRQTENSASTRHIGRVGLADIAEQVGLCWAEILEEQSPPKSSTFAECGGDSLSALELVEILEDVFMLELDEGDVLNSSVDTTARVIRALLHEQAEAGESSG